MAIFLNIRSAQFKTSSAEVWDGLFLLIFGGVLTVELEHVAWIGAQIDHSRLFLSATVSDGVGAGVWHW